MIYSEKRAKAQAKENNAELIYTVNILRLSRLNFITSPFKFN